ncbi:PREDICTED: uncharacterized protein LOC104724650 [Camelina sativa]|uniref:Uncharacterized protein LOC104724650 n=1 Tax=Camelina sativa TaxID=90675 RepID=A0ABM0UI49_CAMSA|nr:PREDICTED: uncharacterized protein LOC104724650 [Camelina sativa]
MEVDDTVIVQPGKWILHNKRGWEFKMDTNLRGRCARLSSLRCLKDLVERIREMYGGVSSSCGVGLSYMFEDRLAQLNGFATAPIVIRDDREFRCFKSLSLADKTINLFVCFREMGGQISGSVVENVVGGEVSGLLQPSKSSAAVRTINLWMILFKIKCCFNSCKG